MIAIPAVDIRDGACVQLVGGSYAAERVRLPNPGGVARSWADAGFTRLHVVDLDAATGRGSNERIVRDLLTMNDVGIQVGGGVRSEEAIERLLSDGADYVVLGTRAIEEPDWLHEMASVFPGELVVAADVRDRKVVTHGWQKQHHRDVLDVIDELNESPLAGVLVTAVHMEGQMRGTDLFLMEDVAERSEAPVLASGGITTMNDLRSLADRGIAGAVIGMALYTGALDPRAVASEFSA
ncbi:MAG TPA: 1-(5-phosphoribosyl)-5-[(5-phosphoribosylamino)methylideneamino] imidazole-4-carboxamide isomerase [Gemmatimonadaceae bacterium]|nr:1-(5-phosphoribosyl)-5-[(5-phosphoribosylamino)methylideneamino] imidazole-4-carboxamide isomerase [Gemmatimonadaceae bacterium]